MTTDPKDVTDNKRLLQRILWTTFNNLDEKDKFLELHKLPNFTQEEINSLNNTNL